MASSPSHEQKLIFAEAFLCVLTSRAPEVAAPFNEALKQIRESPRQREVDGVYHDFLEWCRCLPPADRQDVSKILITKIGLPLDYFDERRIARIAKIVTRGFLRSDDEWRLIEERVQELSESETDEAEILRLNDLLGSYEAKKRA